MQRNSVPEIIVSAGEIHDSKELGRGADGITYRCRYTGSDPFLLKNICKKVTIGTKEEYYLVLKIYHPGVDPGNEKDVANTLQAHKGNFTHGRSVVFKNRKGATQEALASEMQTYNDSIGKDGKIHFNGGDMNSMMEDIQQNIGTQNFLEHVPDDLRNEFLSAFTEDLDIVMAQMMYSVYQGLCKLHELGILHNDSAFRNFLASNTVVIDGVPEEFTAFILDYGRSLFMDKDRRAQIGEKAVMPLKSIDEEALNTRFLTVKSDLFAFRIAFFEGISALLNNQNLFNSMVYSPVANSEPDSSLNVGLFVRDHGNDVALGHYVGEAEKLTAGTYAEGFFSSFRDYILPKDSFYNITEEEDKKLLHQGYENFFERTLLSKTTSFSNRIHATANVGELDVEISVVRPFIRSLHRLMKPPISEMNRTDDLYKIAAELASIKLDDASLKANIVGIRQRINRLMFLLQPAQREQFKAEALNTINLYEEKLDQAKALLARNPKTLRASDFKIIMQDVYPNTLKKLTELRDQLESVKGEVKDDVLMDRLAMVNEMIHVMEGEEEVKVWNSFNELQATIVNEEAGKIHNELTELVNKYNEAKNKLNLRDPIVFAKQLRYLLEMEKLVSQLKTVKSAETLHIESYIDFSSEQKFLKQFENDPTLNLLLSEFRTSWNKYARNNYSEFTFEQNPESNKTRPQVESQINIAINFAKEMQSVIKSLGTPDKIKKNIDLAGKLLGNLSLRGFDFKNAKDSYIKISLALSNILALKEAYELKFSEQFDSHSFKQMLAIAALNGVDVTALQTYGETLIDLTKEVPHINSLITQLSMQQDKKEEQPLKSGRDRSKRTKNSKSPLKEEVQKVVAPETLKNKDEILKNAYQHQNQFIFQMNDLVTYFLNPDNTLKENSFFSESDKLVLLHFLKPYMELAKLAALIQVGNFEDASQNLFYDFVNKDENYLQAIRECVANEKQFLAFLQAVAEKPTSDPLGVQTISTGTETIPNEIRQLQNIVSAPNAYIQFLKIQLPILDQITPDTTQMQILKPVATTMLKTQVEEIESIKEEASKKKLPKYRNMFEELSKQIRDEQNQEIKALLAEIMKHKDVTGQIKKSIEKLAKYGLEEGKDEISAGRAHKVIEILKELQGKKTALAKLSYLSDTIANDPEIKVHRSKTTSKKPTRMLSHLELVTSSLKHQIESEKKKPETKETSPSTVQETSKPVQETSKPVQETKVPSFPSFPFSEDREEFLDQMLHEMLHITTDLSDAIKRYEQRASLTAENSNIPPPTFVESSENPFPTLVPYIPVQHLSAKKENTNYGAILRAPDEIDSNLPLPPTFVPYVPVDQMSLRSPEPKENNNYGAMWTKQGVATKALSPTLGSYDPIVQVVSAKSKNNSAPGFTLGAYNAAPPPTSIGYQKSYGELGPKDGSSPPTLVQTGEEKDKPNKIEVKGLQTPKDENEDWETESDVMYLNGRFVKEVSFPPTAQTMSRTPEVETKDGTNKLPLTYAVAPSSKIRPTEPESYGFMPSVEKNDEPMSDIQETSSNATNYGEIALEGKQKVQQSAPTTVKPSLTTKKLPSFPNKEKSQQEYEAMPPFARANASVLPNSLFHQTNKTPGALVEEEEKQEGELKIKAKT